MKQFDVRSHFPLLAKRPEIVYLDSAATTLKPNAVIQAVSEYLTTYSASVHRGLYMIAQEATEHYEQARQTVAQFIKADDPSEIIFTKGTTESINLVAYAWGRVTLKQKDELVVTVMEHHSNFVPWQTLAKELGVTLKVVDIDEEGRLLWSRDIVTKKTKLVAVTHVSNVLGTINPVSEIVQDAHEKGALVLVDGAQAVGHMPIDVSKLDVDFYAFSGHKMYGPTGIGVLYGKRKYLESMPPFLFGGSMIREVYLDTTTFADIPKKFEAGTPPILEAIGLGVAAEYLKKIGRETVWSQERALLEYALPLLVKLGLQVVGPNNAHERGALVAWDTPNVHPHDLAQILAGQGIAVRAGHHCAMPLHARLGIAGTTRASFGVYSTRKDIRRLIAAIKQAQKLFSLLKKTV